MEFNKSQETAVHHSDGPLLVLAGPGSGKTTVITHRILNLIEEHHVAPEQILVITFTKAAATEMKTRFLRLTEGKSTRCIKQQEASEGAKMHKLAELKESGTAFGRGGSNGASSEPARWQDVTFGTFHAVYFMILRAAYHFQPSNILDNETKYRIMRELIQRYRLYYDDETELMENLLDEISKVKTSRIELEHYYSSTCGEAVFRDIFQAYQQCLYDNRKLDFDDILTYTYELLSERKDILAAWQKKFRYILVDEFQDINKIQYDILRMLAAPENNLFIVGDDDQSIYRFRGANPEIMLGFEKQYPDAKEVLLNVNYRSTDEIISMAGNVIAHNVRRFAKQITGTEKHGKKPDVVKFPEMRSQALYIIKKVQEGLDAGLSYSDFAVLFRTNRQPGLLMELLMEYNIPYLSRDRVSNLYEHWICEDFFAYFRLAQGSAARKDLLRIINRPKRYISRESLTRETVDFEEWKDWYEKQPRIAERIDQLEHDLAMLSDMSPYAAVNYIRKGVGYDEFIRDYAHERGIERTDLMEVLDRLQESAKGFRTYREWAEHIVEFKKELTNRKSGQRGDSDGVWLATLHGAKGLEFHTVFLIDCNEGFVPYKKAVLEADIEEERRLFYVGMTRAKEELYLLAISDKKNGKAEPSRFLSELHPPSRS